MSFREWAKQKSKQTKSDIKAFLKRKDGSDKGTSRPNTPSSIPPHTASLVGEGRVGTSGPSVPGTPPPTQAPTGPSAVPPPGHAADADHHLGPPASGKRPQEPSGEASGGKGLETFAKGLVGSTVDGLKFGPFQDISDMFQSFANMYIMEGTVKKEHEALQHRLQAMLKALDKHSELDNLPAVMSKITEIREFVEGQLDSIGNKQSGKDGRLRMANGEEERFLACCRRVQEYMDRLTLDTNLSTSASISGIKEEQAKNFLSTSLRIGKVEEEQLKDRMFSWISRLPSSPSAWYDSNAGGKLGRRECTPGTRVDVLAHLVAWAGNDGADAVYWLNGMAGTGKTTIACSICKELARHDKLAASFFCSRLREECRDVN
ncbi:hypothetical protein FRC11_003109, partial [Ceratobasidium sp. 423]